MYSFDEIWTVTKLDGTHLELFDEDGESFQATAIHEPDAEVELLHRGDDVWLVTHCEWSVTLCVLYVQGPYPKTPGIAACLAWTGKR